MGVGRRERWMMVAVVAVVVGLGVAMLPFVTRTFNVPDEHRRSALGSPVLSRAFRCDPPLTSAFRDDPDTGATLGDDNAGITAACRRRAQQWLALGVAIIAIGAVVLARRE